MGASRESKENKSYLDPARVIEKVSGAGGPRGEEAESAAMGTGRTVGKQSAQKGTTQEFISKSRSFVAEKGDPAMRGFRYQALRTRT